MAGIDGGMNRLVTALLEDLDARGVVVVQSSPAQRVERDSDGVFYVGAGAESLTAERLVVATEGPQAIDLLADAIPELQGLRPAEGAGVSLVTLVVDCPELDVAPRGTGMLVAPGSADVSAKALTHATAKWPWLANLAGPGRHVLRLSYGRLTDAAARLADSDDETLIAAGVSDAAALLGVELSAADVLDADVVRHGGALPMATPGHRALLTKIAAVLEGVDHLDVVGAWRVGTGLTAVVGATRRTCRVSVS